MISKELFRRLVVWCLKLAWSCGMTGCRFMLLLPSSSQITGRTPKGLDLTGRPQPASDPLQVSQAVVWKSALCSLSAIKALGRFHRCCLQETCSACAAWGSSGKLEGFKWWAYLSKRLHQSTFDEVCVSAWMVFRLLLCLNGFASSPQLPSSTSSVNKWSNI